MTYDLPTLIEDSLVSLDELASAVLLLTLVLECLDKHPEDMAQRVRVLVRSARASVETAQDDLPYRLQLIKKELTKPHLFSCPGWKEDD